MVEVPNLVLNDGRAIPQFGLGVWQVPNSAVTAAVLSALEAGYRSVDTAAMYRNEDGVGAAIAASGVPRADLFVTTKLRGNDLGYDAAMRGFDESLRKLKSDYVDLYLIHWPGGTAAQYVDAWKAFEGLRADGRARSIGVSNFGISHLRTLFDQTGTVPAVNQVEVHPDRPETDLRAFHAEHGIVTEAYSPLAVGRLVKDRTARRMAERYGRTPAQILLRWNIQLGNRVIPKSVRPERIRENLDVFDFELTDEDMALLADR
ncbi:2,5-diketo-D-gluconate reductase A [Actinocrispum wychmicini]|uniref:2,5-diketo-D-gluconate reductase A n=1 Tax=Actinocrispum wychmicini TaxID=1213861 RepID=A0A4R2J752_9PSEU|nr:2,5-diketo-D-gluconate reductase A [Actinocrispum wychmicini]